MQEKRITEDHRSLSCCLKVFLRVLRLMSTLWELRSNWGWGQRWSATLGVTHWGRGRCRRVNPITQLKVLTNCNLKKTHKGSGDRKILDYFNNIYLERENIWQNKNEVAWVGTGIPWLPFSILKRWLPYPHLDIPITLLILATPLLGLSLASRPRGCWYRLVSGLVNLSKSYSHQESLPDLSYYRDFLPI